MALATFASIPCSSGAFAELSVALLQGGKMLRFRARGASMAPLVRDGDVLLVQPVDAQSVRVGDVVLCSSRPGCIVVHRVVRRVHGPTGRGFVVQGDQVAQPDGLIPEAQVYGRMVAIERAGTQIGANGPLMRALGDLAAVRSRWQIGRGGWFTVAGRWVSKLPGLSRYLG